MGADGHTAGTRSVGYNTWDVAAGTWCHARRCSSKERPYRPIPGVGRCLAAAGGPRWSACSTGGRILGRAARLPRHTAASQLSATPEAFCCTGSHRCGCIAAGFSVGRWVFGCDEAVRGAARCADDAWPHHRWLSGFRADRDPLADQRGRSFNGHPDNGHPDPDNAALADRICGVGR